MPQVNASVEQYSQSVDFVMVYIEEAHASDEWPIYQVDIEQHKSIEARISLADKYRRDFDCHKDMTIFADTMDNDFNCHYASWPFRFWVLQRREGQDNVTVEFKAMPQESKYRMEDLTGTHCNTQNTSRFPHCSDLGCA